MNVLRQAFADINTAINDISSFRRDALPQMTHNILELNQLSKDTEKSIEKMEKAKSMRNDFDALEIN